MDAFISGIAARAVFIDIDNVSYVEAESPDVLITTTLDEVPYLLLDAHDTSYFKS